jgi:hypothetical protein
VTVIGIIALWNMEFFCRNFFFTITSSPVFKDNAPNNYRRQVVFIQC